MWFLVLFLIAFVFLVKFMLKSPSELSSEGNKLKDEGDVRKSQAHVQNERYIRIGKELLRAHEKTNKSLPLETAFVLSLTKGLESEEGLRERIVNLRVCPKTVICIVSQDTENLLKARKIIEETYTPTLVPVSLFSTEYC